MSGKGNLALGALITAAVALSPASSLAQRSPTRSESKSLKSYALSWCREHLGAVKSTCKYGRQSKSKDNRTRVSTVSPRYAWADVVGEGLSGLVVRRPKKTGGKWKVIAISGGGVSECTDWTKKMPKSVVRDLRLVGLKSGGEVGRC